MPLNLSIVVASTRPGRGGPSVTKWVEEEAGKRKEFNVSLIDLQDFDLPLLDEPAHPRLQNYTKKHTRRWSEAISPADAFIFVSPEYDYFPPASIINALQCLSVEWRYKVAAIVSYGGVSGGLRATQELRQLLGNLNVMAIPQSVPITFYTKHIDEEKKFVPLEAMNDGLKLVLDELHKWGPALKQIRA